MPTIYVILYFSFLCRWIPFENIQQSPPPTLFYIAIDVIVFIFILIHMTMNESIYFSFILFYFIFSDMKK